METDETTMAAEQVFAEGADKKPTLKMSEVFAAMKEHRLELDCIGGLIGYDKERVLAQCDMTKLSITDKNEVRLALIHQGVSEMIGKMMHGEGMATAYISKHALEEDLSFTRGLMRMLESHDGESADADGCDKTGEEVCHE